MRVAVLGAGLQGTCVAMDLATTGVHVDLFDRNPVCISQASLQNEGKIHLGYVYAKDASLRSTATMIEGAATFGPLLERWLDQPMSRVRRSALFNYAVHRDSMLSVAEFEQHLRRTHDLAVARISGCDYLGLDIAAVPQRLSPSELAQDYDPCGVSAVYRTSEASIDPHALGVAVRARVAGDELIRSVLDTEVHGVRTGDDRIIVDFTTDGERSSAGYDHVVNALWDGRLAVDATIGLTPERPWLFRVKHFVRMHSPSARLPSTTIVLGPFGDIVDYGDGDFYLSWYPSGMQRASSDVRLADSFGTLTPSVRTEVRDRIVGGLASIVPRLAEVPAADLAGARVEGGVIFAWGTTDIGDAASGLHNRFAIGPRTVGRYHSVDTGKLTTAPLYARLVADRIRAAG